MTDSHKLFPLGPLTAMAIADAAGCGTEYLSVPPAVEDLRHQNLYKPHTLWPYAKAGTYSDDTQRALAIAEYMLKGQTTSPDSYAYTLAESYIRDPRGASPRMIQAFQGWAACKPYQTFYDYLRKNHSLSETSSGAAMGAAIVPMTIAFNRSDMPEAQIQKVAQAQAKATHTSEAVLASDLVAWASYMLNLQGVKPQEIRQSLMDLMHPDEVYHLLKPSKPIKKPQDGGMTCFLAALQEIEQATSLYDLLLRCIALGGNTDTVAAIALGCAWNCKYLKHDLPLYLWYDLEDGFYGRSYLRKIELALMKHTDRNWTLRMGD